MVGREEKKRLGLYIVQFVLANGASSRHSQQLEESCLSQSREPWYLEHRCHACSQAGECMEIGRAHV